MKKTLLALTLLLTLLLPAALTACGNEPDDIEISIFTLNGTTGFGVAPLMDRAKNGESEGKYVFTVRSDASDVTAALINGDADIAMLPTNAAANLWNVTNGGVRILAVNTRGCLYLLCKGETAVTSFADLKGKTVYVPAQNPTVIFTALCQKNGLEIGKDVTVDSVSYAAAANLRDAVASGAVDYAVLPEPMVTIAMSSAKQNGVTLQKSLDLNAEWHRFYPEGSLVQGCVVARTAFLEEHPDAAARFLDEYRASVNDLLEHPAEGAQKIVSAGIFTNAAVAEKALPGCNICYLDGEGMKSAMQTYLSVLLSIQPKSIGGTLPGENFYYLPEQK